MTIKFKIMTIESVKEANILVNKIEELQRSITNVEEMMNIQNVLKPIIISNKPSQRVIITSQNNDAIWNIVLSTLQSDLAVLQNELDNFGIVS